MQFLHGWRGQIWNCRPTSHGSSIGDPWEVGLQFHIRPRHPCRNYPFHLLGCTNIHFVFQFFRSGHSIHPRVPFVPKPLSYLDDLVIPDLNDKASILEETKNFLNQKHSPFDLLSLGLGTSFQDRLDFMNPTQENENSKIQTNLLNPTPTPNSNPNPYFTEPPKHISHPLGVIRDFGFLLNDPNDIFMKNTNPNPFLNTNDDDPFNGKNLDFLKQNPLDFTNFQKLDSNLNEEDQEFLTNHYKEGLAIKEELENLLGQRYYYFKNFNFTEFSVNFC